jgi:hypothetical protein
MRGSNTVAAWMTAFFLWELMGEMGGMGTMGSNDIAAWMNAFFLWELREEWELWAAMASLHG